MYVCMYVCMYSYMYVCMYSFMYVCFYVFIHSCKYVCMYSFMYVFIYSFIHSCKYVCICMLCYVMIWYDISYIYLLPRRNLSVCGPVSLHGRPDLVRWRRTLRRVGFQVRTHIHARPSLPRAVPGLLPSVLRVLCE